MPKEILTVAQIGTFDCKNFGDLLFPNVLEWHLKKRRKNVELVLFSPIGGEKPFECGTIVHPICDLEKLHRCLLYTSQIYRCHSLYPPE